MYFFVFILFIYILAKIFSRKFRELSIDNINFFKLDLDENNNLKKE
jgi:hypothetical protein